MKVFFFHSLFGNWGAYLGCALLCFACTSNNPTPINPLIGTWKYNFWTLPNCSNPDFSSSIIKPKDAIVITESTFNGNHYIMDNKSINVTYPSKEVVYSYTYLAVNNQQILTLTWKLDTGCTVNGNYSL